MKKTLVIALAFLVPAMISFSCPGHQHGSKAASDKVEVRDLDEGIEVKVALDGSTTKPQLEEVAKVLKDQYNVDFDYSNTTYADNGTVALLDVRFGQEGSPSGAFSGSDLGDQRMGLKFVYIDGKMTEIQCGGID